MLQNSKKHPQTQANIPLLGLNKQQIAECFGIRQWRTIAHLATEFEWFRPSGTKRLLATPESVMAARDRWVKQYEAGSRKSVTDILAAD